MKSPCKGCADRSVTCHSECEKYLAFFEWSKEQRKQRMKYKDANCYITDAVAKAKRSSKAWKGKA